MSEVWKPSVTVAAIVEKDGKYLIVEEHTTDGIKLNQPAGHLDPGEAPENGAARECLEESAWVVKPVALLGVYLSRYTSSRTNEDITYLRFAFVAEAVEEKIGQALDDGIIQVKWLSYDELKACEDQHRSPLVLRCVEDLRAYKAGIKPITPLSNVYTHPSVTNGPMPPGVS
ncbi:MAG: NUDIX hydrolase [Limnobacter sp.]|nr:NUDIX hydrolase [Limnobacter sp.]